MSSTLTTPAPTSQNWIEHNARGMFDVYADPGYIIRPDFPDRHEAQTFIDNSRHSECRCWPILRSCCEGHE